MISARHIRALAAAKCPVRPSACIVERRAGFNESLVFFWRTDVRRVTNSTSAGEHGRPPGSVVVPPVALGQLTACPAPGGPDKYPPAGQAARMTKDSDIESDRAKVRVGKDDRDILQLPLMIQDGI